MTNRPMPLAWLIVCSLLAAVALGYIVAVVPARLKLLGLFSIAIGGLVGFAFQAFARRQGEPVGIGHRVLAALVTGLGLIGAVCGQVYREPSAGKINPIAAMVQAQLNQFPETRVVPPTFATRLQTALSRRIEALGDWNSPWPELFWVGELTLGMLAAAWAVSTDLSFRNPDAPNPASEKETP